eukprot:CAMPEP_0172500564 /NCGR_PEP_ID=MMETSP1066-20121228/140100_1 /TAXON_ID=671091 /ORGANISM="Coscinodiscus wailesii, Strain CCMP2513" /LENGTH=234 /DNA_ID=CAMNT_0013274861 /DNA_START=147 /DNA_END=851 /DNA_ORIENTATION=-
MKPTSLLIAVTTVTRIQTTLCFVSSSIKPKTLFGSDCRRQLSSSSSDTKSDFGSSDFAAAEGSSTAADGKSTTYERIGFTKETVAMGVDPLEVLQWLGTRDDLVTRFISDNPKFDKERAEIEVDKFIMDAEMVNKFITFEKKKADPEYVRKSIEENMNDPSAYGTYAVWIIGGVGYALAKNLYFEPKYRSGELEEFHLNLGDLFKFGGGDAAVTSAADAASASAGLVSQVTDVI